MRHVTKGLFSKKGKLFIKKKGRMRYRPFEVGREYAHREGLSNQDLENIIDDYGPTDFDKIWAGDGPQ